MARLPISRPARRPLPATIASLVTLCLGVGPGGPAVPEATAQSLTTVRVASGLARPVLVTAPAGDDRLFILEQAGRILILKDGVLLPRPFLDITSDVVFGGGNDERGLLGLAFHPRYEENGLFYLHFSEALSGGNTMISEFQVSSDPDSALPDSTRIVFYQHQPFANHNGGTIAFSPVDSFLYVGLGDGGSADDPGNRAQNPDTLLGKFLRLDVDGGTPYAIPPTNPWVGDPAVPDEVWAFGVRNPYRWSFDRDTGDLWIADVGQNVWEEIDFQPASSPGGENYGWRLMEGPDCFNPPVLCGSDTLDTPVWSYSHSNGRCSVTGGYVYRGQDLPALQGTYFFADFCTGEIWSFRLAGNDTSEFRNRTAELAPGGGLLIQRVAAIGEDGHGELYIVDRGTGSDGEVFQIVGSSTGVGDGPPITGVLRMSPPVPNPFSSSTSFTVTVGEPGRLVVDVYDVAGRRMRRLVDREVDVGPIDVFWDGTDAVGRRIAGGHYFIRARVGDFRSVQSIGFVE